ncbi:MAG: glycosyltransferase [Bacillus sp. (in: firmicutes)]
MSTSDPLVSVIIPFYNCSYVAQAIESVLSQTYPHIELLVVNDGSYENQHLITPYLSKITYIEQTNKGVASALNQGIKHAKGEYLVWLSSDDLISPYKIEHQLNFMQENNALISFTCFNIINNDNQITQYNVGKYFKDDIEILQTLQEFNPINGCTVMFSKEIIKTIGFFDENLKYAQDYDYWIRTALHFPIHYFHMTLTNYRVHEAMGSIRFNKEQNIEFHSVRSKYKIIIGKLILEKEKKRRKKKT